MLIKPDNLVRIDDGCKEAGKVPSRSIQLHQRIYEMQPLAFDRLEVAEYSAKAIISAACLGELVLID